MILYFRSPSLSFEDAKSFYMRFAVTNYEIPG